MTAPRPRLLLLTADTAVRRAVLTALADDAAGFLVEDADDADDALDRCRAAPPDCLLLDARLPDAAPADILTRLRQGDRELPLAVVALVTDANADAPALVAIGIHHCVARDADPVAVRSAVHTAVQRHTRIPAAAYRVLIIDDSPEDRAIYRRRLARGPERFVFAEADNGAEGLALCRSFRPDCVLLDYHLPDTDGIELLASLVHDCGGDDLAVLMLTGQGNESIAVRALKAGAEDYLVKGPALETLPQAVRAAIEKIGLRRRLAAQRREIERSRNQLQVTLASIGDAVAATDPEGRVTFLNASAEALTGWRSAEASGRPLVDVFPIVHEHTREPAENPALRALRDGRVVGLANHTILIARDGTERPIDDSAAPIRGETGEVHGAVLVFRDITDRKRIERSLQLQSRVLDNMTEGVCVTDETGTIFYTNPAEDRMYAVGHGERLGRSIAADSAGSPAEAAGRTSAILARLRLDGTWTGDWRSVRKDGSTFTAHARMTTFETDGRRCFVRVQEDVSDRRHLEDELQHRVGELALAHRRKDEFLAMLAHELRNPLSVLHNALHVLKLRGDDPATVEQLQDVMARQVGHFGRLVDDLLDVSRITQGKVTLRRERLDLARLARDGLADHQAAFERAGITLTGDTPATPVWVQGDTTRLTQIVDNFLTNALKFTNPGGAVTVTVAPADDRVVLTVRDDGIGIEPDVLPTIFDVFSQADKTLARSPGGLGLGLAIVKGLVGLHGGTVAAASDGLGCGATMRVHLPLEREPPALAPETRPRRFAATRRRVLVVEDNRDSAEILRVLLELSGYLVRLAFDGHEGIAAATDWHPDAVVCDIGLPGLDGFAVARHLRQQPATVDIRLIAVTGYGRAEDIAEARAAGFDDHLVKPADPETLLDKLGSLDDPA